MTSSNDTSMRSAEVVATEMGDLLVRSPLAPGEDFFLSGGDSLRAVELISRLVARFGPDEESADRLRAALLLAVFDEATPAALARILDTELA